MSIEKLTDEERAVVDASDGVPMSFLVRCVNASQVTRGLAPLAAAIIALRDARSAKAEKP